MKPDDKQPEPPKWEPVGAPFDEDLEKGRARHRCTHPEDAYTRLDALGKEEEP